MLPHLYPIISLKMFHVKQLINIQENKMITLKKVLKVLRRKAAWGKSLNRLETVQELKTWLNRLSVATCYTRRAGDIYSNDMFEVCLRLEKILKKAEYSRS